MRCYGMGYREVMSMPIRAFWIVSGFVERLQADEAKLNLDVAVSATDPQAAQALMERLNAAAPEPVTLSGHALAQRTAVRDEGGFQTLTPMAG
jgi:hypothetical protein